MHHRTFVVFDFLSIILTFVIISIAQNIIIMKLNNVLLKSLTTSSASVNELLVIFLWIIYTNRSVSVGMYIGRAMQLKWS